MVLITMNNFIFICHHLINIVLPQENGTSMMAEIISVLFVIVFPAPRKELAHSKGLKYISRVNE